MTPNSAHSKGFDLYPSGIVSIVSDTYDLWQVCTDFLPRLKEKIAARDGKVVIRPDSGDPELILCGDPNAPEGSPARRGVVNLLADEFGTVVNDKGFRDLARRLARSTATRSTSSAPMRSRPT